MMSQRGVLCCHAVFRAMSCLGLSCVWSLLGASNRFSPPCLRLWLPANLGGGRLVRDAHSFPQHLLGSAPYPQHSTSGGLSGGLGEGLQGLGMVLPSEVHVTPTLLTQTLPVTKGHTKDYKGPHNTTEQQSLAGGRASRAVWSPTLSSRSLMSLLMVVSLVHVHNSRRYSGLPIDT